MMARGGFDQKIEVDFNEKQTKTQNTRFLTVVLKSDLVWNRDKG
jgi:hypothetical protein